ncbi:hypothetical protein CSKR_111466 [Clonorchis sinensis]|uniref:Fibronectin type-III domain-containing protein n=1 Tax=Clonorchis sinensis TaxID=79923 RepID=A0A8T1N155_CLOSI|nr:hypothetical protein CSKR_111466 [Clonorchis sinensis]
MARTCGCSGVPNTPTNIQIRRTGLKKWSMSWNDTSDCRDSPDYIYRVHIYVDGAPEVIERTLRSRSTTVTNIDPCKLTWIRVMAVGAGGESPMSDPMKLTDPPAPQTPTNIQVQTNQNSHEFSATWEDNSECLSPQGPYYAVGVYDGKDQLVLEKSVTEKSAPLGTFDACSAFWLRVSTIGVVEVSAPSNAVRITDPPLPNTPTNIQIRRTGLKKWSMSWNDTSDCRDSPDYIYRVHIYVDGAPEVIERTFRSRSTTVTNIDPCILTWIQVKSVLAERESPMSTPMKLTGPPAPQTPTNIQVQTNQNSHEFSATWEDNSECLSPQGPYYAVGVYDGKDQLVLEKSVTEKSAPLGTFDACSAFWLRVSTIGVVEVSAPSNAVRITDPPLPSAPKLIGATTEQNVPSATVSWTYDGACASTDFLVTVYATAESVPEPVRASGLSTSIGGLPMCVDLVFGVVGRNQFGSGQETKSSPIRIDAVPVAPSTIRVKLRPNEDSATVSWKYGHTCPVESFQVSLYDADGLSLRTMNTNDREVYLDDLPVNVPLLVDVLGRNYLGNGPRSERVQFFLPRITRSTQIKALSYREPRRPINIVVSVLRGRTEVNVSWTVANSRTISSFTAKLYNGSSVIQQQTTEYLNTSFRQVDPCSSWTVGVIAHNAHGTGEEWFTKEFRIPAVKSPEPPGSVTIQPHRCKRMVTVSWTHHTCAHNFTVYFYTGDTVTNKETTRDHHITYGNTPRSMNFRVGVVARNDYGTSAEAISAEFRTPGCCDVF